MREVNNQVYRELRCDSCRALLALEYVYVGRLSIKCSRCGEINTVEIKSPKNVLLKQGIKPTKISKNINKSGRKE